MNFIALNHEEASNVDSLKELDGVPHIWIRICRSLESEPYKICDLYDTLECLTVVFNDARQPEPGAVLVTDHVAESICWFVNSYFGVVDAVVVSCDNGTAVSAGVASALSELINGCDAVKRFASTSPNLLVKNKILANGKLLDNKNTPAYIKALWV